MVVSDEEGALSVNLGVLSSSSRINVFNLLQICSGSTYTDDFI